MNVGRMRVLNHFYPTDPLVEPRISPCSECARINIDFGTTRDLRESKPLQMERSGREEDVGDKAALHQCVRIIPQKVDDVVVYLVREMGK